MSLRPILFTQVPQLDTVLKKLSSSLPANSGELQAVATDFVSWLKTRFPTPSGSSPTTTQIQSWVKNTTALVNLLPIESLFPLVDLWRLAVLDPGVAAWISSQPQTTPNPFKLFLHQYLKQQQSLSPPRAYTLTLLRLLCNSFAHATLCQSLLNASPGQRDSVTKVLVSSLLSEDTSVRTAGGSLAFNCAATIQAARVHDVRLQSGYHTAEVGSIQVRADELWDEDWHVELVSALLESLAREENDDVSHRLIASLGCLLRLSPFGESALSPLLEVLQAKQAVQSKLGKTNKEEVKKLVHDVEKLC